MRSLPLLSRNSRFWCALVALALALRVGYAAHALRTGLSNPEADAYETIARNLLDRGAYDGLPDRPAPTAAREPGFPLFIALVYAVVGTRPLAVLAALALLNVAGVLLLAAVARRLSGEKAAALCALFGLFYPYFIYYCAYFYREIFLTSVVALLLYLAPRMLEERTKALTAATGFTVGLLAASMSTFLLVDAFLGPWLLWRLWRASRSVALCALLTVVSLLPPGAWIYRNYRTFHRLIPGSTLGGFNLYTALIVPEEDRGTQREYEICSADPTWMSIMKTSTLMEDDGSQQEAFIAASSAYIRAHPKRFAVHLVKQALKLWRPYPYERRYNHSYLLIKLASLASDGWLIPLGLFGLWRLRRRDPDAALAALLLVAGTGTYSIISAIVRYRLPLMAPLLVFASCALKELLTARERDLAK